MDNLLAARSLMAISMAFHIIFSCIGMVMPFIMAIAHYKWNTTGKEKYYILTKTWSRGVSILFVTGAVSGTMLSFELGLLWPRFMQHAGPIFGMPFSLEGTAFFIEAIALGFYMYGWEKFNKWFHWFMGILVGISGVSSGILVVAANGWMNSPTGFEYNNGIFSNIDPLKAMMNDAWFSQALHMIIAAFSATGFGVAGIHAYHYYKGNYPEFHKSAFKIALTIGAIAALIQPISGDISAKDLAKRQPLKLAAIEAHFQTQSNAPLILGGIVDTENETVNYAIKIPGALSFLAHGNFHTEVKGLNEFPKDEHPPVVITHYAFQIMVICGIIMMVIGLIFLISHWKFKYILSKKWFLYLVIFCTPLGFIAVEAGWTVTEVGRQPWIIYGIMKTKDGVTQMPGIQYSFYFFILVYIFLTIIVTWIMRRQIRFINEQYSSSEINSSC
ncbi:MAG: cytochrome ubiquinol oxidase subunit I [Chitinophagales bacterium]|nr:cytochrome ubiquinol oxidase subunit I [Chitinophagales bacterium]